MTRTKNREREQLIRDHNEENERMEKEFYENLDEKEREIYDYNKRIEGLREEERKKQKKQKRIDDKHRCMLETKKKETEAFLEGKDENERDQTQLLIDAMKVISVREREQLIRDHNEENERMEEEFYENLDEKEREIYDYNKRIEGLREEERKKQKRIDDKHKRLLQTKKKETEAFLEGKGEKERDQTQLLLDAMKVNNEILSVVAKTLKKPRKKMVRKVRKACGEDQERNPETERCIKKCGPDQFRHPETNRCRKKLKTCKRSKKIPSLIPFTKNKRLKTFKELEKEEEKKEEDGKKAEAKDFVDTILNNEKRIRSDFEKEQDRMARREENKIIAKAKQILKKQRKEEKNRRNEIKAMNKKQDKIRKRHEKELEKKEKKLNKKIEANLKLYLAEEKESKLRQEALKKAKNVNAKNIIRKYIKRIKEQRQKRKEDEKLLISKFNEEEKKTNLQIDDIKDWKEQGQAYQDKYENALKTLNDEMTTLSKDPTRAKQVSHIRQQIKYLNAALDTRLFLVKGKCLITNKMVCDNHFYNNRKGNMSLFPKDHFPNLQIIPGKGVCNDDKGIKLIKDSDNNCVYLSNIFKLYNDYLLISYISKGSNNTIYRAINKKVTTDNDNNGYAIRIGLVGEDRRKQMIAPHMFDYGAHIHKLAYKRLTKHGIKIPKLYESKRVGIGSQLYAYAGVGVFDLVEADDADKEFMKSRFYDMRVLAHKFGRTLGVMHEKCNLTHGDSHMGNFKMDYDSDKYHAVLDMDNGIDLNGLNVADRQMLQNYDLSQAYSSIYTIVYLKYRDVRNTEFQKIRDHLFRDFTLGYLDGIPFTPLWKNVFYGNFTLTEDKKKRDHFFKQISDMLEEIAKNKFA